jgi:formylglycine-generating enzyme
MFKSISLLLFLFAFSHCTNPYLKISQKESKLLDSQAAPPDMIFIPGEGDMEPYYMSVIEEPNINYIIYLEWLHQVYGSTYPEICKNALPKNMEKSSLYVFNDPAIEAYMTHPAFSYYPVVGLTYEQIQNYLIWKSNMLNEYILINQKILKMDNEQRDQHSFNNEAHLLGQYMGNVNRWLPDKITNTDRPVMFSDGIIMGSFRLPTEAEWERASTFNKALDEKRYRKPFSSNAVNVPLGENYYTFLWGKTLNGVYNSKYLSHSYYKALPENFTYDLTSNLRKKGFNYQLKDDKIVNGYPSRLTTISDYDPNSFGIANMETGVKEMIFDAWEEQYDSTLKNTLKIFEKNKATKGLLTDNIINQPVEKDSLGRMKGIGKNKIARLLGKDNLCRPVFWSFDYYIASDSINTPIKRVIKGGTWKQPSKRNREPILENVYSDEVGFRAVLPYFGIPTEYKVKWR